MNGVSTDYVYMSEPTRNNDFDLFRSLINMPACDKCGKKNSKYPEPHNETEDFVQIQNPKIVSFTRM